MIELGGIEDNSGPIQGNIAEARARASRAERAIELPHPRDQRGDLARCLGIGNLAALPAKATPAGQLFVA